MHTFQKHCTISLAIDNCGILVFSVYGHTNRIDGIVERWKFPQTKIAIKIRTECTKVRHLGIVIALWLPRLHLKQQQHREYTQKAATLAEE